RTTVSLQASTDSGDLSSDDPVPPCFGFCSLFTFPFVSLPKHALSDDGRYLVFLSHANNLVPGKTNFCPLRDLWFKGIREEFFGPEASVPCLDVFVYDRLLGSSTRVNLANDGAQANRNTDQASISGDGQHVAFSSFATNLVSSDTNEFCPAD